jgi:hypothetical protein
MQEMKRETKSLASLYPNSFVSGASTNASRMVIASPSFVLIARVSPSAILVTIPSRLLIGIELVLDAKEFSISSYGRWSECRGCDDCNADSKSKIKRVRLV